MSSIIIEYDLRQPGRDYRKLHDAIKGYGTWARVTESTWFIKTDETCAQIRDKLKEFMDQNDCLFVGKLSGEAAWYNIICKSEFLKDNI